MQTANGDTGSEAADGKTKIEQNRGEYKGGWDGNSPQQAPYYHIDQCIVIPWKQVLVKRQYNDVRHRDGYAIQERRPGSWT